MDNNQSTQKEVKQLTSATLENLAISIDATIINSPYDKTTTCLFEGAKALNVASLWFRKANLPEIANILLETAVCTTEILDENKSGNIELTSNTVVNDKKIEEILGNLNKLDLTMPKDVFPEDS